VLIVSFVSSAAPLTTAGDWADQNEAPPDPTNDVFQIDAFQADPLARLDLVFTGNTGEETDVTRVGAFYDNDEQEFKSRIGTNPATISPVGPFLVGTRQRNAQRLAARNVNIGGTLLPPNVNPVAAGFLYPGMGQSTFRVSAASNTLGFGAGDAFALDGNPYVDVLDANGLLNGGNFPFDDMPFGWSLLP
jgi:hypothetical protein